MRKQVIDLHDGWRLAGFDGYGETIDALTLPAALPHLPWIAAAVPGSVYSDLMRAGWLDDVYAACNSLAAQWVENFWWFYRREFDAPRLPAAGRVNLVLEGLDLDAVVFLNGACIGTHHNVFHPCRLDITGLIRGGRNELIVRVDAGLLAASDRPASRYNRELTAVATRRAGLRKPQFACRWDWSPRLVNVGIGGGARLECFDVARLHQVAVTHTWQPGHTSATLHVRAWIDNPGDASPSLRLGCRVAPAGVERHIHIRPQPGLTCADLDLVIDRPELWWPRELGAQHFYKLNIELAAASGEILDQRLLDTGIRSIELAQPPAADGGRLFHLLVNGQPLFCKGANWVPAELLWPRVTPTDYAALVALAADMNANLLRVWGGGRYEHPAFFSACDQTGIVVWNDLPFACTTYPADDPGFLRAIEAEVRWNVREICHHPSLLIWCGNNEIDLGVADGWIACTPEVADANRKLFHETLRDWITAEDPSRPYWPTSPFSPAGRHPNDPANGDQHAWYVGLGAAKGDYWQYRKDASRFPNEGGVLGPSTPATLRAILPESERCLTSRTWMHHDNTQNTWRGEPMLAHLLRTNFCIDPRKLSFNDYVRYAAILHGEALETAIDNWRRRKFDTSAAVFWMFNDTWPAVTSWTPIDFYRRRKPAYWYVKRAFAPLRAICVEQGGGIDIFLVNDSLQEQPATLRYGIFNLAGGRPHDETLNLVLPPNAATRFPALTPKVWNGIDPCRQAAFAILEDSGGSSVTQRLFRARFRDLDWPVAPIAMRRSAGGLHLVCETFAWSVSLDEDGEQSLADNFFDLVPGIEYFVPRAPLECDTGAIRAANPPRAITHPR